MPRFDPSRSLLAGMDTSVLQARLQQMQNDYLDLVAGRKAVSGSYTQGDGGKSITYTAASADKLMLAIRQLQAQLGIIDRPRRALSVSF